MILAWGVLPFFRVSLLSFIFAILSQISSLVVDEAFTIELLGNLFSLYNKIFLLIFFLGLYHLFYTVCFRGHTIRVDLSFGPLIFLFYPEHQDKVFNSYFLELVLNVILEVFLIFDNFLIITTTWKDSFTTIPSKGISWKMI
jgi:hypothetical protein